MIKDLALETPPNRPSHDEAAPSATEPHRTILLLPVPPAVATGASGRSPVASSTATSPQEGCDRVSDRSDGRQAQHAFEAH